MLSRPEPPPECRSPGKAAAQRVKDRYAELTRRMTEKLEDTVGCLEKS